MKHFIFITIIFSILSFSLFGFGDKPLLVFNEEKTKARFEKGKLTVDVSFSKKMWTSLSGEITAEIIDVNDNVLLSEKKDIRFFRRSITTRFVFKTDISCEELFVYRLRVNFESKKSKTTYK